MAKVSIVIPTYNRAAYVGRAIASTLSQAIDDLEVIVVDDGSTDATPDVVASFADARLKYIVQENRGATAAFNRGLDACTGEYIGILGSDDWYVPNGLVPLVAELDRRSDLGLVSGGYLFVDESGERLSEARSWLDYPRLDLETWLFACPVLFQAALIRRTWVHRLGGVATGLQDWDFGLRLAHQGCEMGWIPELIFCYRMHPGNSVRDAAMVRRESLAVLERFFANRDLSDDVVALKGRAVANAYLKGAVYGYDSGHVASAAEDLEQAIQLNPALIADRAHELFTLFVARATHPLTSDRYGYLELVFSHLPMGARVLAQRYREAIAAVAMSVCFEAHRSRDWSTVRPSLTRAIRHNPKWLLNRGVCSIAVQALLRRPSGRAAGLLDA